MYRLKCFYIVTAEKSHSGTCVKSGMGYATAKTRCNLVFSWVSKLWFNLFKAPSVKTSVWIEWQQKCDKFKWRPHKPPSGSSDHICRQSTEQVLILAGKQISTSVRHLAAMERTWMLFMLFVWFIKLKRNSICSVNNMAISSAFTCKNQNQEFIPRSRIRILYCLENRVTSLSNSSFTTWPLPLSTVIHKHLCTIYQLHI